MMLGVVIGMMPFVVVAALLAWSGRRERRRAEVAARQIALTEVIHERLGGIVAPVVRRHRGGWQVSMAVPFERPGTVQALLAIVREAVAPVEIVLTRQPAPVGRPADGARAAAVTRESVSWS
jgi:hypothetical protein